MSNILSGHENLPRGITTNSTFSDSSDSSGNNLLYLKATIPSGGKFVYRNPHTGSDVEIYNYEKEAMVLTIELIKP